MKIRMYYLADIFTLAETLLAVVLFVMAVVSAPPDHALWVFIAGELCDAADGPCARHWHYPKDGKYRWWRHYNSEIDQISDIMLAVACGVYLIWRISWKIGSGLLFGIGIPCLIVQLYLYRFDPIPKRFLPRRIPERLRKRIVLIRRAIYVYLGVGGAITTMLWHTEWPFQLKAILTSVGVVAGGVLTVLKIRRLLEPETPL